MQFEKMGKKNTPPAKSPAASSKKAPASGRAGNSPDGRLLYEAPVSGGAAKPAAPRGPFSFLYLPSGRLDKKLVFLVSVLGASIALLLVLICFALILPGCRQTVPVASLSTSRAPVVIGSTSYDQTQNSLPTELLQGTILAKTEDAGEDYVKETLFLGDSNTVRLCEFSRETGITLQNGIGVVGEAIQGAVTNRNIIFSGRNNATMAESVAIVQPRRVVITFGTNNVGYTPVDKFIESYSAFLALIRESYPYADIIIAAVPPIAPQTQSPQLSMGEVDKYNKALAELAEKENCKFLNWSEALKDESTGYARAGTMERDGIHITRKAAEEMIRYFRTHSHITEDTRPKPLKTVPTHIQTPAPVAPSSSQSSSSSSKPDSVEDSSLSSSSSSSSQPAPPPEPVPPVSSSPAPAPAPDPATQPAPEPTPPEPPPPPPDPAPATEPIPVVPA